MLLLLCFVLPLSKCVLAQKEAPVVGMVVEPPPGAVLQPYVAPAPVIFYGYELFASLASNVAAGKFSDIAWVCMWVLAFFAPSATLLTREPWRSGVQFFAAFPSLYGLLLVTFAYTPLIGGLLAVACWVVLLILSIATLWQAFRNRKGLA